jgi:hypothetical protein
VKPRLCFVIKALAMNFELAYQQTIMIFSSLLLLTKEKVVWSLVLAGIVADHKMTSEYPSDILKEIRFSPFPFFI